MLDTAEDIRRHVTMKLALHELREPVAQRMLALLDAGAEPRYAQLLEQASFPDPPGTVYHTAPVHKRDAILREGLRAADPTAGPHWEPHHLCLPQPGVYVGAEPDIQGIWAHWPAWDVWAVARGSLPWRHDRVNPGCWSFTEDVPPGAVVLHGTFGRPGDSHG
jgi:hypothetical protein